MRAGMVCLVITACAAAGCTGPQVGPTGASANGNGDPADQNDVFAQVERFSLVATTVGSGTVEPAAGTYESGQQVTLTATGAEGWQFDHWEGDASGTDPVITITVEQPSAVVAWFVKTSGPLEINTTGTPPGGGVLTLSPGAGFATAPVVELGADDSAVIDQTLLSADDVHVYDLGAMAIGDRLIATCEKRFNSQLDPMIALFDADGYRVFWNDDISLATGDYDGRIDGLIRHDSEHHYLAVASTDFQDTTGAYRLTVEVRRGAGAPQVAGQTVVLDIDGASSVVVAGQNWGSFGPLDAGDINAALEGQTDALLDAILSVVQVDYVPYNVTILTTDDPTPPAPFTTVYLGGHSDLLFGIADDIDFYNANRQDNVIVFAQSFGDLTANLAAMGQAIANVISHEIGHALGLMHTTDVTELMDTTGDPTTLLVDQQFGAAEVFDFPIGFQNAPLLLTDTLGLSAHLRPAAVESTHLRCGTCGAVLYKPAD